MNALLEVRDLHHCYDQQPALRGIGFNLQRGEFHALLGPNGAGKSTLFGLISRLLRLQRGEIILEGESLGRMPSRVLEKIGMVFQQSTLDLDLTVAQNLHYHASLHGLGRKERAQRIDRELARLELGEKRDTRVRALNGGHRRRVEIARALLHRPRLLLLDEATVGLDSHARRDINQHVRQLCREQGVGVLWATHLIEEIAPEDSVTLLHQGRVLADASSRAICEAAEQPTLVAAFEQLTRRRGALS